MNQSDEEEDFHSADEEGFGGEEQQKQQQEGSTTYKPKPRGLKQEDEYIDSKEKNCNEKVINKERVDVETEQKSPIDDNNSSRGSVKVFRGEGSSLTAKHDSESNEPSIRESKDSCSNQDLDEAEDGKEAEEDDDDDEEEEALAGRIRERNLKIARKFSAEIARSLRVSAPIPVKTSNSTSHEFPEIPYSIDRKSSFQPPAPPSTPALSSSFNNCSDPTAQISGSSPSLNTQYGWRIPPKMATQQSSSGSSTPSKNIKTEDQARQVLDRLTERLSQTDKNLFERVAADIKKVSIKDEEVSAATTTDVPSALTSITDFGSTLGGWGWSGATKLLSSASQVTSQVGSVLDSVVGVSASNAPSTSSDAKNETGSALNMPADKTKSSDIQAERVLSEVTYNDPLVDLTLNAMESLGKKAFEVMTTRDETGSLQIKGLGRPWEHLLNTRKVDHSSQAEVREEQAHRRSSSPPPEPDQIETLDYSPASQIQSDSSSQSSLKLRKRRQD